MTDETAQSPKAPEMNAHVTPMTADAGQLPPVDARSLISEGSTRLINLDGQIYTLRITRAGKLILTK
jgi:hemin uptake protein HemP